MIGPTGVDRVFTATAQARRNPMAVPSAVGQDWDPTIQRRQRAIRVTSIEARSPPRIPPAHRLPLPNALPTIEPTAPPSPPSAQATKNKAARFTEPSS